MTLNGRGIAHDNDQYSACDTTFDKSQIECYLTFDKSNISLDAELICIHTRETERSQISQNKEKKKKLY